MSELTQFSLFGDAEGSRLEIEPAAHPQRWHELGAALAKGIRFGTSSWGVPGWRGLVWAHQETERDLSQRGLKAYVQHPLFRTVGIDRSYYQPPSAADYQAYAEVVDEDFRFMVKAHQALTLHQTPDQSRYGRMRGLKSPHFLDPQYCRRAVIEPLEQGLGAKLGVLVFQFPPQNIAAIGGPVVFADKLYDFLSALPSTWDYAVELRNEELLTRDYHDALEATDSHHCFNIHPRMPDLEAQSGFQLFRPGHKLILRWMLHPSRQHDEAHKLFHPYSQILEQDFTRRAQVIKLIQFAQKKQRECFVTVNNKAEGCSPMSIVKLAEALVRDHEDQGQLWQP